MTSKEIEINEMNNLLFLGSIRETERGSENVYFEDTDGNRYFCKCL